MPSEEFKKIIKESLKRKPDIIYVGKIRDSERDLYHKKKKKKLNKNINNF